MMSSWWWWWVRRDVFIIVATLPIGTLLCDKNGKRPGLRIIFGMITAFSVLLYVWEWKEFGKGMKKLSVISCESIAWTLLCLISLYLENLKKIKTLEWENWSNLDLILIKNCLVSPLIEEIIYRHCLITVLISRYNLNPMQIVFKSSLLFSLAHITNFNRENIMFTVVQFAYTYLFGVIASIVYLKSGSVICCAFAHSWCNFGGIPLFPNSRISAFGCVLFVTLIGTFFFRQII